ncbi:NADH-quinone oxidoreductase subunit M [Rhodococcus sp. X156]|uniref:NADH-quinone oxidoreductase subunit M n=1 Tax=Rhodococcus sp. X156 TaxID=2499145 RepID=UPI000FD79334|nr:NADH-quinone oxidoreductase subunit M [Rhodococcus sp. X156]
MSSSALLLALLLLPLAGAALVLTLGRTVGDAPAKVAALGTALVELALVAVVWAGYSTTEAANGSRLQMALSADWIPAFGVHFALGLDGIALVLVALVGVLVPVVLLGSWKHGTIEGELPAGSRFAGYFATLLVLETFMMGVFLATDVFLFYVFFEGMLVPMYFLIGRWGGPRRQFAAMKFFLYSLFGGLVMLAALIGLYVESSKILGTGTFDWRELVAVAPQIPHSTQVWLFLGFFLAFAIKAPLVPLHTWLPDAGAEAPIGSAVLLVGVLDKVGTFGFLRYCLPLFPSASRSLAWLVLVMAVLGVLYGALVAVGQTDLKRWVAYTSVAHFGFIALGVFAFTQQSATGAVLYMVNHGVATGLLFLVVGMVIARGGSRRISDYRGMARATPVLAGLFLLAALCALALPGTSSFVSEFLVLLGSYPTQPVYTILATVGIILAALYSLWVYQRVMQGPEGGAGVEAARAKGRLRDVTGLEVTAVAPLVALILLLGFYPKPVLDVITPSVSATLTELGVAPEAVTVPAQGGQR